MYDLDHVRDVDDVMKLADIEFKESYDSNFHDIIKEFFEPALSAASKYDRQSGFFTSSSLSIVSNGIAKFIENGGKMRLLTSPVLSEEDAKIISEAAGDSEALSKKIMSCMEKTLTAEEIEKDGTQALGWMLANGFLEIRIVLLIDDKENVLSSVNKEGIFHNKFGIIGDGESKVAFSGSLNETGAGLSANIEDFDVYCSWLGDEKRIQGRISRFERYWSYGTDKRKKTVSFPDALKNHWIEHVPKEKADLHLYKKEGIKLRPFQQEAIDSWIRNDGKGIFSMATGTGKTYAAVHAVKQLIKRKGIEDFLMVVSVPFQHLITQWEETIRDAFKEENGSLEIVLAFDNSSTWRPVLRKAVNMLNFGAIHKIIVITTYDTLSKGTISEAITNLKKVKIIVGDEVHNAGATKYREGLAEDFTHRLGLSATPTRYFDDEGSMAILNFFGEEVFEFSIEKAINTINPSTDQSYLTPYNYYPIFVSCSFNELEEYAELSKRIAKYSREDLDELTAEAKRQLEQLRVKRSRIIKRAASKVLSFSDNIAQWSSDGFLNHCIVYCSDGSDDDNIKYTQRIIAALNKNGIKCRRFTSEEQHVERKEILQEFGEGNLNTLVAIKCLDEGVDVPSTENAFIMASTGNPREYIQRRGRVLRRYPGKTHANIFDFIVVPGEQSGTYIDYEKEIFKKEYIRFIEFSKHSLNQRESLLRIKKEADSRGIQLEENQ